jgi:hypothetical protein
VFGGGEGGGGSESDERRNGRGVMAWCLYSRVVTAIPNRVCTKSCGVG